MNSITIPPESAGRSRMLPLAVHPNAVTLEFNQIATLWLADSALVGGSPGDERQLLRESIRGPVANGE
jgi:hypothetical protein